MMEHPEIGGGSGAVGGGVNKGGEGFIDRSKVRILLCDNDTNSSEEVFKLLCKCSYQVTSVRSARQVIDALNAEGPDIDIILAEVDLPMAKGMKMLKYITRDKELQRIPVIMMSALDEVSVVVKCLRLGAADYLVKPLRTNELLNLWTHMWRRRRMLGLAEKNILTYDFDLVGSDPSDANTNSTTLFSDDTDERSRKTTNLEANLSVHQEDESIAAATAVAATAAAVEPPASVPMEYRPNVPGISDRRTGQFLSGPKKSELKVGESSAFLTYVKSSMVKHNAKGVTQVGETVQHLMTAEMLHAWDGRVVNGIRIHDSGDALENHLPRDELPNSIVLDSTSLERSCTPPMSQQFPQERNNNEEQSSQVLMHTGNKHQLDPSGFPPQNAYPYYMANQVTMPPSAQLYQKNLHDLQNLASSGVMSQYNHLLQCHSPVPGMASLPYYPVGFCLQPGQMPSTHPWPSVGNSSSSIEPKSGKVDRREAALMKFRQKRKERCFDKKIRYVNRKKLAERRPRVRGQFVRKVNGIDVDLNGEPAAVDFEEDEEEYEEQASRDSSPEDDTSGYKC